MLERIDCPIITQAKPIQHMYKVMIDDYLNIKLCIIGLMRYLSTSTHKIYNLSNLKYHTQNSFEHPKS